MEGELQGKRLLAALRVIGRRRKTGILTVQGRDEIIAFSFSAGGIVGADALNQSLEDGLGSVLSSQHLVDPSEFAGLVAEHEAGGGRVVDLLVERSLLSRGQLLESLRLHTYRLCLEALSWQTGEYRFYQGDEVAFEAGVDPIGVGELLVRSSQDLGGAGLLTLPIPRLDDVYSRTQEAFDEGEEGEADSVVTESARRALELVDGQRSLREVAAGSDLTGFDIQELASEWVEGGIVERTGMGSEEAAPAEVLAPAPAPALSEAPLAEEMEGEGESPSALDVPVDFDQLPVIEEPPSQPAPESPVAAKSIPPSAWQDLSIWLHRLLGLTVLAATFLVMIVGPARVLLPFPWQGSLREELKGVQRSVQRLTIEQGAQTFFLLFGRYPESLEELRRSHLVLPRDLVTPNALPWRISANPASYALSVHQMSGEDSSSWTSSVAGNFLLDPEYVRPVSPLEGPLLVLLD